MVLGQSSRSDSTRTESFSQGHFLHLAASLIQPSATSPSAMKTMPRPFLQTLYSSSLHKWLRGRPSSRHAPDSIFDEVYSSPNRKAKPPVGSQGEIKHSWRIRVGRDTQAFAKSAGHLPQTLASAAVIRVIHEAAPWQQLTGVAAAG